MCTHKGEQVSYRIKAFIDMPEGVPHPALNADTPIEVGDRIVAINNVKGSTSNDTAGEVGKVKTCTVFTVQIERYPLQVQHPLYR